MSDNALDLEGIYPPVPTFFDARGELDLATLHNHIQRLTEPGNCWVAGIVALGSNGEAAHLDDTERGEVIRAIRETAPAAVPVLAGASAQSTRATLALCEAAARDGAAAALVLPPSYFRGQMTMQALVRHYHMVADASPIPVVIYNMPGSTGGLDLDAATILAIAEHPRVIGVKDSAGNVTKLTEIAARARAGFRTLAGSAGFLLPALVVGASGAVAALANILPRQCHDLIELFHQGKLAEARELQARLTPINTAVTSGYGVPGLKAALELSAGYGGAPRAPLLALGESEREQVKRLLTLAYPAWQK
ncbi:MAG TPA: dihydrodipicolinate synthase family protein [Ktedonobacterales bacterium]|jgi:4-hydroxy-2-oxoglutarate aldolase